MDTCFTVEDTRTILRTRYPDPEDPDSEHPMALAGILLLSAAILGTTDAKTLIQFTGYSPEFISAITFNMQNNKLWFDGRYDHSGWLSSDGNIDDVGFWDHISAACGDLWFPKGDAHMAIDACAIHWNSRRRPRRLPF